MRYCTSTNLVKQLHTLNTNKAIGRKETAVSDYNIELQGVYPYSKAGIEYSNEEYCIWIIVSKNKVWLT